MKKILVILLSTFLLFACESKEERELRKESGRKFNVIVEKFEEQKYQKVLDEIKEFEEKYPNFIKKDELQKIKEQSTIKIQEENEKLEKLKEEEAKRLEKEKIKEEKKMEVKKDIFSMLNNLSQKYDEFQNITWVTNKRVENNISVYGGFDGKTYIKPMFYRLVVSYSGKDWIFFEKMIVITDSGRYEINFKRLEQKTDVGYGYVYETYDVFLDNVNKGIVRAMVNSDNVKIRLEGRENVYDFTLTKADKAGLKTMIDLMDKEQELLEIK